ncbi:MAG TPA: HAD family phosphatase [Mycobacteriales bacterium]|nr:HAD family phosphatase [Mycobacteriales bacterium]
MPSQHLRGVLFDLDGTLVDSEKIWDITLRELAAELGGELSAATRADMVGTNLLDTVTMLHDDLGIDADTATSGRFLLDRTREYFARGLRWRPGAQELLHAVRTAGLPAALVTSTTRDLVEVALDTVGRHHFDAVVCCDEVTRNKPHPQPYLRAAELLGLPPGACVAVEDSRTGAASAESAGCVVLAVPAEVPVPAGTRRLVRTSLVGVTVDYLVDLHRSFATPGQIGPFGRLDPGDPPVRTGRT